MHDERVLDAQLVKRLAVNAEERGRVDAEHESACFRGVEEGAEDVEDGAHGESFADGLRAPSLDESWAQT